MQAQTDMKSIIEIAETFLEREYIYRPSAIFDVDHPFLEHSTTTVRSLEAIQELNTDNVQLIESGGLYVLTVVAGPAEWELYKKIIRASLHKCETVFDVFSLVTMPYHFEFLKAVMPFLSLKDFSELFRDIWVYGEGTNQTSIFTKKELTELFSSCDPEYLMDEEELEVFRNLPLELTIYRGVNQRRKSNVRVFSWTLSKDKAEWFSRRPTEPGLIRGVVYQANIKKEHIFAYFAREQEIIVNPPKLYNITEL